MFCEGEYIEQSSEINWKSVKKFYKRVQMLKNWKIMKIILENKSC